MKNLIKVIIIITALFSPLTPKNILLDITILINSNI